MRSGASRGDFSGLSADPRIIARWRPKSIPISLTLRYRKRHQGRAGLRETRISGLIAERGSHTGNVSK
jgi:hypothetical protein